MLENLVLFVVLMHLDEQLKSGIWLDVSSVLMVCFFCWNISSQTLKSIQASKKPQGAMPILPPENDIEEDTNMAGPLGKTFSGLHVKPH